MIGSMRIAQRCRCVAVGVGSALALVLWTAPATALQFIPNGNERLHTITNGPGTAWNTAAAGDFADYDSGTERVTLTGVVDILNYFDTTVGSGCETDAGSNCDLDFAPDLTFTAEADFAAIRTEALSGTIVDVFLDFETTGGIDLTLSDPTDLGAGNLLPASWVAGTYNGDATTGLTVKVTYDTASGTAFGDATAFGILEIASGATYEDLFESGGSSLFALNVNSFFSHSPSLDSIIQTAIGTGSLPDFTSEGQGQVFRVASGEFEVPEPSLLGLLGVALGGLVWSGRRRR